MMDRTSPQTNSRFVFFVAQLKMYLAHLGTWYPEITKTDKGVVLTTTPSNSGWLVHFRCQENIQHASDYQGGTCTQVEAFGGLQSRSPHP